MFDLAYGYKIDPKVRLTAEISFYREYHYTNYKDARFKEGGYHMIDKRESDVGIGTTASYFLDDKNEIYIGYNSIKKFNGGMRFRF